MVYPSSSSPSLPMIHRFSFNSLIASSLALHLRLSFVSWKCCRMSRICFENDEILVSWHRHHCRYHWHLFALELFNFRFEFSKFSAERKKAQISQNEFSVFKWQRMSGRCLIEWIIALMRVKWKSIEIRSISDMIFALKQFHLIFRKFILAQTALNSKCIRWMRMQMKSHSSCCCLSSPQSTHIWRNRSFNSKAKRFLFCLSYSLYNFT